MLVEKKASVCGSKPEIAAILRCVSRRYTFLYTLLRYLVFRTENIVSGFWAALTWLLLPSKDYSCLLDIYSMRYLRYESRQQSTKNPVNAIEGYGCKSCTSY
jgi:hypothetical protein